MCVLSVRETCMLEAESILTNLANLLICIYLIYKTRIVEVTGYSSLRIIQLNKHIALTKSISLSINFILYTF